MTQKNETLTLTVSFLVTLGILGGGLWWLLSARQPQPVVSDETTPSPSPSSLDAPDSFTSVENVPNGLLNKLIPNFGYATPTPSREHLVREKELKCF